MNAVHEFSKLAAEAVKCQRYDVALDVYARWFEFSPDFFDIRTTLQNRSDVVHIRNAANLARKALNDKIQPAYGVSQRLDKALAFFFGTEEKVFQNGLQKPAFFYIPDLPSKPFYQLDEIPGLAVVVKQLIKFKAELSKIALTNFQQYTDTTGPVPNTSDWQDIKSKWLSTHLIKGDVQVYSLNPEVIPCLHVFDADVVAHCPPHAAEVFISTLLPTAEIPPHFGVSNLKLTVHIPLSVNSSACLTVGGETMCWLSNQQAIVFDDSFLHSANNLGAERRDVLIFDVWHPQLTITEKQAICHFMAEHQRWSENYAKLAGLDAGL